MPVLENRTAEQHRAQTELTLDRIPANDSKISRVEDFPTYTRLRRARRFRDLCLLDWYREVTAPVLVTPSNDNDVVVSASESDDWHPDAAIGLAEETDVERNIEVRPTINEMIRAAARVSVTITRGADGRWSDPVATADRTHGIVVQGDQIVLGDLVCRAANGNDIPRVLVRWKSPDGTWMEPRELPRGPKGASGKRRSTASIISYLSLGGVTTAPATLMPDGGATRERPEAKLKLEAQLRALGVDSSVPFDLARRNAGLSPVAADRTPALPGRGVTFLGGATSVGRGRGVFGDPANEREYSDRLKEALGTHHSAVLDVAVTDAKAEEIGEGFGYRGQYARRKGVAFTDQAIAALEKIAA